jgi:peptide/nickel transport system ATP-binding protein
MTAALDVSVQAAVLTTLGEPRRELRLAILFIGHDLDVVATIADRVILLEHGRVHVHRPTHRLQNRNPEPREAR